MYESKFFASFSFRRPPPFKVTKLGYFAEYIGLWGLFIPNGELFYSRGVAFGTNLGLLAE